MKTTTILSVGIAAIALAQTASADTIVRFTGSTAFRAAASNAILDVFNATGNTLIGYAYNGTSFTGATYQVFQGTIGTLGTFTVKTDWSGSVEGVRDVALGNAIQFLANPGAGGQAISAGGTQNAATFGPNETPGVALTDASQGSTPYKSPTLSGGSVGIVPFAFVASKSAPASVTNINNQLENEVVTSGYLPQGLFDNTTNASTVYAIGRYFGSGTRLSQLSEIGHGAQTPVVQLHPVAFDANNKVTQVDAYPDPNDVNLNGNGGETSGGTLADLMRDDTTNAIVDNSGLTPGGAGFFVCALGENDSYRATFGIGTANAGANTGNAKYLTYNGVAGFGGVASKPASVSTTSASNVITLPTGGTAGVIVGQIVTGTGIAPGSIVTAINAAANQLTLDKNATVTGTATNVQIGALLPTAFRQGAYSFWNYEYYLWNTAQVANGSAANTFVTKVQTQIHNVDYGFSGLADDATFLVQRDYDGAPIYHK